MHRNLLLGAGGLLYYALACYGLLVLEAPLLVSSLVLFGIPAYLLARYSAAPSNVMITVMALGAGIAVLLEGVAHIYGIWYTLGVDELRLFGLIPIEVLFTSIVQTLFLVLLYELVFDDGIYTTSKASGRFVAFGVFALSVFGLIAFHQYVLQGIFITHSYLWILVILASSSIASLAVYKRLTVGFFKRLGLFSLIASVPLLASLLVAVGNTHKVFAYLHDYLFTFSLLGEAVPIEEIALTLLFPLFVAAFYELYLDDGKVSA